MNSLLTINFLLSITYRYIGWVLGVETEVDERRQGKPTTKELPPLDPCGPGALSIPDPSAHSKAIFQSIIFHLMHPDDSSVTISHHLLKITDRKPPSLRLDRIPDSFYKNNLFYYRCYNCRKMVGDPLADALSLPLPLNFWMKTRVYLRSTLFFMVLRAYSNAARWIPPVRSLIVRWHTRALGYFHENWKKTHKSKMAHALAHNEKASILDTAETIGMNEDGTPSQNSVSLCPFAMTAKPT